MANQLDEAFNWLVLILTTIAGALSQFPEIYPFSTYEWGLILPIGYEILRLLIFPILVLVFFWLTSYLVTKTELQVVLKSLSWIIATIILIADIVILFVYTLTVYSIKLPGGSNVGFLWLLFELLILASPLLLTIPFCLFVIRPRMREIYKDSDFLYNFPKQILVYILAVIVYLLSNGILEEIIRGFMVS